MELCSGDMLLEALVACAGVTLKAVSTALDIPLKSGHVSAEGDLDFRGTLGVAKDAPVGFAQIRLTFDVDTDAPQEKLDQLLKLTERYCVVYQTIKSGPPVEVQACAIASSRTCERMRAGARHRGTRSPSPSLRAGRGSARPDADLTCPPNSPSPLARAAHGGHGGVRGRSASIITERSGPAIGALIATLPVSAGPSYVSSRSTTTTRSSRRARSRACR